MRKKSKTFSKVYAKRQKELQAPVKVSSHKRRLKRNALKCMATWDTGATSTVISSRIIERLKLEAIDATTILTANGRVRSNIYLTKISLGNGISKIVRATEANLGTLDLLIGMDIIGDGDFAISSDPDTGAMSLSYRVPAQGLLMLK